MMTPIHAGDERTHIPLLRFVTAGSVDDGKSTLIGRLLYDGKTILFERGFSVWKLDTHSGKAEEVLVAADSLSRWEHAPASVRSIAARDGIAPIPSERPPAHPDTGRSLAALVFVTLHQIENASDRRPIEPARDNLLYR